MTVQPDPRDRVRAKKMADIVADRIRQQIARGELKAGDWLPTEPELTRRFQVSRPTLREAFRLLEADSLVRVRRGPPGGAQVHIPGPEAAAPIFGLLLTLAGTTVHDLYEAMAVIEPPAVRRLTDEGSDFEHDMLEQSLDDVAQALQAPYNQSAPAIVQFHRRIVELAGNQTLSLVFAMLGEVMTRHVSALYGVERVSEPEFAARNRSIMRAYRTLLKLIRKRDGAEAERYWAEHLRAARGFLLRDAKAARKQVIDLIG